MQTAVGAIFGLASFGVDDQFGITATTIDSYVWNGTVNLTLGGMTFDNVSIGEFKQTDFLSFRVETRHTWEGQSVDQWPITQQTSYPGMPNVVHPSTFPWPTQ